MFMRDASHHTGEGRHPRQASMGVMVWCATIASKVRISLTPRLLKPVVGPGLRRDDDWWSVPFVALTAVCLLAVTAPQVRAAERASAPHLGTAMTADEVAKWDLSIFPDGRGLPEGKGVAKDGAAIFDKQCAGCHGDAGRGGTAEELVSEPLALTDPAASKAIGPYWPFATTVFDFIRRSMPAGAPGSLTPDELYAVTAYLLAANKVIAETDEMNAKTLPAVKMPNRDGFEWIGAKK